MLLYALLHLTGYADMTIDEIKRFRQLGSQDRRPSRIRPRAGRRDDHRPARARASRPSVGMAIAEAALAARFGDDLVDHHTYVIAGDGCLMEGVSHEAIDLAGHLKLNKLIVLWDDNRITIDGSTALSTSDDQLAALRGGAAGTTIAIDGHDPAAIEAALDRGARPATGRR